MLLPIAGPHVSYDVLLPLLAAAGLIAVGLRLMIGALFGGRGR